MLLQDRSFDIKQEALLDEKFLATLSEHRERDIYARIISLDINENPIDQIEGKVTSGSINIDGSSAVRRTCSLTMISNNIDINDYYWGLKTKFKLEIGLRNQLTGDYSFQQDNIYPEIVWFSQGYFVISAFNTSITTNNCNIFISGKDKMCLLNGDLGGQLFAEIDFGTEEEISTVMEEVSLITNTSSEEILSKNYYIKLKNDIDDNIKILNNHPSYCFIRNQLEGNFYKEGNFYCKVTGNISKEERESLSEKYYDGYKLIDNPSELYEELDSAYEPNKYYYLKDNSLSYYILDTSAHGAMKEEDGVQQLKTHYKLVPLFQKYSNVTKKKNTIEKIIRESVHAYANEPYHNIIINDLDDYGLEQLTYKGDTTLYALYDVEKGEFTNLRFGNKNDNFQKIISQDSFNVNPLIEGITSYNGSELVVYNKQFIGTVNDSGGIDFLDNGDNIIFTTHKNEAGEEVKDDKIYISDPLNKKLTFYTVAKIEYGTDVGYRLTELIYPGDLIAKAGDTLTSILDKIKNLLGDFEYFYDENGKFIFQRKKVYVNISWNQLTNTDEETYIDYSDDKQKFSFNFENGRLISAIQHTPALNNLRNDFAVWGKRKGISGADIPIHARYAIDKKPVYYKALNNQIYTTDIKYAIEQGVLSNDDQTNQYSKITYEVEDFSLTPEYVGKMQQYNLSYPEKNNVTNRWSPGWWDIRDWARYYRMIKGLFDDPNGTMKFYSSGDEDGCVPISSLNLNPEYAILNNSIQGSLWLIMINKETKKVNLQHGTGIYNPNLTRECTYYETISNSSNSFSVRATLIKQNFPAPYSGCSDNHTYQYFLNQLDKYDIYFYNPKFPFGETEDDIIAERIVKDYKDWEQKRGIHIVDWREIIYQMALDYFAGQGCSKENPVQLGIDGLEDDDWKITYYNMTDPDHFLYEVGQRNPYYYPTGYTGYEQYYTDMQGFWRQLYNPNYIPTVSYTSGKYENKITPISENSNFFTKQKNWISSTIENYTIEYYISDISPAIQKQKEELQQLINNISLEDVEEKERLIKLQKEYNKYIINLTNAKEFKKLYWNCEIFNHPETLNFWIDFLDSDAELAQFSVKQVGDRMKVTNEDKASAIIYSEIPNFILYNRTEMDENGLCDIQKLKREITLKSGYKFIYLPSGYSKYFTISYRTASIKDKIDELLYKHAYCTENISITSIPIYYLKPNTRIFVQDKNTGIDGEYIVSKLTLPLTYNGTMSITASKAPERLY